MAEPSVEALYAMAYNLYNNGKYSEAEKCFLLLTMERPKERKYWMGLGACYEKLRNYGNAVGCYSTAAVLDPSEPLAHFHAANCYFAEKNKEKALEAIRSAITVASEKPENEKLVSRLKDVEKLWCDIKDL